MQTDIYSLIKGINCLKLNEVKIKKITTEDTGKIFEMAICLIYNIIYDGKFKYNVYQAEKLKERLVQLPSLFPQCIHTAKKGSRYDFTTSNGLHLSAKTTKKGVGKVAPQVIGQCKPQKFCDIIQIQFENTIKLKEYIQTNIKTILPVLVNYTFDCDNIFYNEEKEKITFIKLINPIDWKNNVYTWTCDWETWNNSSTLKIEGLAIVEFQFHTRNRTNMAIRWCYENVLEKFKDNFKLTVI